MTSTIFWSLYPAFTVFRLFQRPIVTLNGENYLLATIQDVLDAKALFDAVSLTTKTSTEAKILRFYYNLHPRQNQRRNSQRSHRLLQPQIQKSLIENHRPDGSNRLEEIEWIDARAGQQKDSRAITYYPLQGVGEDANQTKLDTAQSMDMDKELLDKNGLSIDLASFLPKGL